MNKRLLAIVAALPLAACASDYAYNGPVGPGPIGYDGYYDDYYGPIYDGYWGDAGVFYYRRHAHGRYFADRRGHFRREMGPGRFHAFHGSMTPPAAHMGGHHR